MIRQETHKLVRIWSRLIHYQHVFYREVFSSYTYFTPVPRKARRKALAILTSSVIFAVRQAFAVEWLGKNEQGRISQTFKVPISCLGILRKFYFQGLFCCWISLNWRHSRKHTVIDILEISQFILNRIGTIQWK